MSEILIDCTSEAFTEGEQQPLEFEFRAWLNTPGKPEESPEAEGDAGPEDILTIRFNHSKPVPEEVKEYIANNLGIFDLVENGEEKAMIFELKINDINIELIRTVFENYFASEAADTQFLLSYSRSQSLPGFLSEIKENMEVPLFLHLLESSRVRLEGLGFAALLSALFKYVGTENAQLVEPWMNLLLTLSGLRLKGTVSSFKKLPKGLFKALEFDQRDNIKDFFYVMDNPINRYIFEMGQPGNVEISGRILNILNYEFKGSFPNLRDFLGQVLSL